MGCFAVLSSACSRLCGSAPEPKAAPESQSAPVRKRPQPQRFVSQVEDEPLEPGGLNPSRPGARTYALTRSGASSATYSHIVGVQMAVDGDLEWLNFLMEQFWPWIDKAAASAIQERVLPKIQQQISAFRFTNFSLGDRTPQLGPVQISQLPDKEGVGMMVCLNYVSEVDIGVAVGPISVGIRELTIRGDLYIRFSPLLTELPVIGAIQVFFVDCPEVDMDFTGLANIADIPGISSMLRGALSTVLSERLTVPNTLAVRVGTDEQVKDVYYKTLKPVGLLTVTVVSAKELLAADWNVMSANTSDPYVQLTMADVTWRSATVDRCLNPVWGDAARNTTDFVVYHKHQQLRIAVYDHDLMSADDLLGVAEHEFLQFSGALHHKEPFTTKLYSSEQLQALREKRSFDVEGESRGELTLSMTFRQMVESLGDEDDDDRVMLELQLKHFAVNMPKREAPKELRARVTVGAISKESPPAQPQQSNDANLVWTIVRMERMVQAQKLWQKRLSKADIGEVLELTPAEVDEAINDTEDAVNPFDFHCAIYFVLTKRELEREVAGIEILGTCGTIICRAEVSVVKLLDQPRGACDDGLRRYESSHSDTAYSGYALKLTGLGKAKLYISAKRHYLSEETKSEATQRISRKRADAISSASTPLTATPLSDFRPFHENGRHSHADSGVDEKPAPRVSSRTSLFDCCVHPLIDNNDGPA